MVAAATAHSEDTKGVFVATNDVRRIHWLMKWVFLEIINSSVCLLSNFSPSILPSLLTAMTTLTLILYKSKVAAFLTHYPLFSPEILTPENLVLWSKIITCLLSLPARASENPQRSVVY